SNNNDEEKTLEMLLKQLPNDANISANDYVHVEDENNWTILTDEDVIELVNREETSSESEAETVEKLETISNRTASTSIDTVLKFLYQQGPEFGEVVEDFESITQTGGASHSEKS